MTTMFKHLQSHEAPTSTKMLGGFAIPPAMQTVIVDRVSIVNPQLTSIIRNDAVSVMPSPEDPCSSCPPHSKMITSAETLPIAACIPVIHVMFPTSQMWLPPM
jgi:hypothetical protein